MKKYPMLSKRTLLLGSLIAILITAMAGAYYVKASHMFLPGPLSAMHPKDQPLNGYASHADFEQECAHCHAPIHCITDTRCQDCHMEIAIQRQEAEGLHGILTGTNNCAACHFEHKGREVVISKFAYPNVNHLGLTGFSLEKHRVDYDNQPMGCQTCHSGDRFIHETLDCLTCHVQEDHDAMASHIELYGKKCLPCHDGIDRMDNFDHNAFYLLEGQHVDTDCAECHVEMVYAGTPQDCVACHADPELHAGEFGNECDRCHTALAWTPAQLTRHTFLVDHGENAGDNCAACHNTTMVVFDCYGCHDHQQAEMDALHLENGLVEYASQSCIECHPTGLAGEAAAITGKTFDLSEKLFKDSQSGSN